MGAVLDRFCEQPLDLSEELLASQAVCRGFDSHRPLQNFRKRAASRKSLNRRRRPRLAMTRRGPSFALISSLAQVILSANANRFRGEHGSGQRNADEMELVVSPVRHPICRGPLAALLQQD